MRYNTTYHKQPASMLRNKLSIKKEQIMMFTLSLNLNILKSERGTRKHCALFVLLTLCAITFTNAQVPNAELLLRVNQATTVDIEAITEAKEGMVVYDTTLDRLKVYDGVAWQTLQSSQKGTIVLNRNGGNGILPTATNTYFDLPLTSAHIQTNDQDLFTVVGNSEIRIEQDGVYALSASLSTSNMPAGNTKYILAARQNGNLIGYLSRGFVTLPSRDYWGSSGTISYSFNANDIINFQYVLNAGGQNLNAVFTNASITKL